MKKSGPPSEVEFVSGRHNRCIRERGEEGAVRLARSFTHELIEIILARRNLLLQSTVLGVPSRKKKGYW